MVPVPVDLSKLKELVENNVVKKTEYDELVEKANAIDTSGFVKKTDCDSKINEIKGEIPSITGLDTAAAFNDAKNKIPDISDLVKKQIMMLKINKILRVNIIIASNYNKFMNEILDLKTKNKKLLNKSDISEFIQNTDLDGKMKKLATKEN